MRRFLKNKSTPVSTTLRLVVVGLFSLGLGHTVGAAPPPRLDLLVVAPHSDDEAIGCTGGILRAVANKRRVGIVVVTAGDGHVKAAAAHAMKEVARLTPQDFLKLAALRQRHTLEAMPRLGVQTGDIFFLGYPDGGLTAMFEDAAAVPFRQPHTQQTETYGTVVRDYHFQMHGRAAPYVKASVVGDLTEILRTHRPQEIYTTDEVDSHPDHRTTFRMVRDAAQAAEFRGPIWTFVVHGRGPSPAADVRLSLSPAELRLKTETIEIYQAGVSPVHDQLASQYALSEELFWKPRRPLD